MATIVDGHRPATLTERLRMRMLSMSYSRARHPGEVQSLLGRMYYWQKRLDMTDHTYGPGELSQELITGFFREGTKPGYLNRRMRRHEIEVPPTQKDKRHG